MFLTYYENRKNGVSYKMIHGKKDLEKKVPDIVF
jgi:hypothetical protein